MLDSGILHFALKELLDSIANPMRGNSSLGLHSADLGESNDSSLRGRIVDSPEAIHKKYNRISPDSWCKKSGIKGAVVPPADFLLESELRGTPPKSEKAAAFWQDIQKVVGGSGEGGAALLRKETSESKKQNSDDFANNYEKLDSRDSLKNALINLCESLQKGQNITLSTSKGAISLSTKSDDFDFILANDISTISLYTRAVADEINALASFEKPLINLNIKEVFVREVGAKNALFILPYDIILCCISSILLEREIAFVYGKKIDLANLNLVYNSTHKSDFFEIIVGQNGYFLHKNFWDLSANQNVKNLSNLWDFLDFNFDDFKGESKKTHFTPHSLSLQGESMDLPKQSTENSDIFIAYLSTKNPTHLANLRNRAQILTIAFDKNPKNILQKIARLENGEKLIANFKKAFEARFRAIQSLSSTPQWTQNIVDIFECASMILGRQRDKNAIFDLAQSYLRDIGPKIDFKNINSSNSPLGMRFRTCDLGNSSLELHSADLVDFGEQQTPSLVLSPKSTKNHESQTENPSVVLNAESMDSSLRESALADSWQSTKNAESTDSSLRGVANAEAIHNKNKSCVSTHRISPDSWCKKSGIKGAVVPPADFLLESELRGTPPKSEKAAAFWRVGGAGRGV